MGKQWGEFVDLYIQLYADCIPVKGSYRSAFYDLTRHEILLFPTEYFPLIEEIQGKRLGDILARPDGSFSKDDLLQFLDFLDDNEFVMLVKDPSVFPPISDRWDYPGVLQNAVIDVSTVSHDFRHIFSELSDCGCQHVQVRGFSSLLNLDECRLLLDHAKNKSIAGIEIILKYEAGVAEHEYVDFVRQNSMLTSLTVHSAPESKGFVVDTTAPVYYEGAPSRQIRFTRQVIDSELHCGIITQKHLTPPSVETFFEAKAFNGCLNRKLSIDAGGNIKNCPSLQEAYGNVRERSIKAALESPGFRDKWSAGKDLIATCKDCEFRYACSDCRAYLTVHDDPYSKPLKCGYDPYSGTWSEWLSDDNNLSAARLYKIEPLRSSTEAS